MVSMLSSLAGEDIKGRANQDRPGIHAFLRECGAWAVRRVTTTSPELRLSNPPRKKATADRTLRSDQTAANPSVLGI
jgi:hypothetical protein